MSMQEFEVNMINNASSNEKTSNETTSMWKPLVIHYEEMPSIMSYIKKPKAMTVEILGPFAYKDNHVVPWKYECHFITDNVVSPTVKGITRSGRCYTPDNLKGVSKEDEVRQCKGKAIEMAVEDDLNDLSKVFTEKTTLVEKETDHEVVSKEKAWAVPSSLHQRLKFSVEGGQAIVYREEDMFVTKTSTLPYVEAIEEALECSYRSFEIANATIFPTGDNQGDSEVISLSKAKEKFGLGYKPIASEWEKVRTKKKEKRSALLVGREMKEERISIPHLSETFKPRELLFDTDQRKRRKGDSEISIVVVSENTILPHPLVHQCPPGFELNNWEIKKTLEVTKGSSTRVEGDVDDAVDFEVPICNLEQNIEEGESDISPELRRLIEQEEKKTMPYQETLKVINLGTLEEVKEVQIGTLASEQDKLDLVTLLHKFIDIFAWSYQDMPGLDTEIVTHQLPLKPECKPIRQKLRKLKPEMLIKIKEEVKKQFDVGFLAVAKYPIWVANIVPFPKKNGKVRMCVDYRDLNRASPKDNFPLPHIDVLVDNIAEFSTFSFMDGFSGYNQIIMAPEDQEKTTFITLWETFCYKIMPFGLKNAGATYQRAMVTLFHDLMHKEIEVYVDDIIAKSRLEEKHMVTLRRIAKWQVLLSEFDIVYITRKVINSSVIVDCLAKLPIEDYEPMKFDFPDEDVMALINTSPNTWTMMFDGATNEIGYGVGAIFMSPDGKWYPLTAN
ncbi:uncharacterized protein E5676_scaffold565G00210 [Cucumis melo var. makuwa]|uniref:Reverse transcriptase domain-containing protein n=1 Tax=Cucumis melo var. makuwa TaxID=1194695 RepID=A0A5A7UA36_CUCMM|nr:uncharacterized protein E6C27_scaffold578G00960 [Cucumis melo var. makuwa]TYJ98088.1 uncharacterized protein E5676_scaffold565G00210 [Cucumis melo var. makuwa]